MGSPGTGVATAATGAGAAVAGLGAAVTGFVAVVAGFTWARTGPMGSESAAAASIKRAFIGLKPFILNEYLCNFGFIHVIESAR